MYITSLYTYPLRGETTGFFLEKNKRTLPDWCTFGKPQSSTGFFIPHRSLKNKNTCTTHNVNSTSSHKLKFYKTVNDKKTLTNEPFQASITLHEQWGILGTLLVWLHLYQGIRNKPVFPNTRVGRHSYSSLTFQQQPTKHSTSKSYLLQDQSTYL